MTGRRELLIDAFNVIFAHPQLGPLVRRDPEAAREQFVALVNQRRPADATRVYVVFDAHRAKAPATETGRQDVAYRGAVHTIYARETADAWIQRRIREHPEPGMITVITSDNAIIATVRAHGANLLRVSDFLQLGARRKSAGTSQHAGAEEKPERVSRRELEEWERLFENPNEEDSR